MENGTGLTTEQCLALLEACVSSANLVDVTLAIADLHDVPDELLGQAAHHLHKIDFAQLSRFLCRASLTTEQSIAVLEACVSSVKLVDVSLTHTNLCEVPAKLLGQAAHHLHKIDLTGIALNTEQCLAVLEACVSSDNLVDVSFAHSNLSEVPAELLGRAAKHLHRMNLDFTGITNLHCLAVLEACVSSAKLVDVSLAYSDLCEVPAELLVQAAKHLHKMNLWRSALINEQQEQHIIFKKWQGQP